MNSHQRISAVALLSAASVAFSPNAWSLGLGDVQVESFLNQPLKARIDLITNESDDLATVTARLGTAADYQMIGASLESIPVPIRFSVEDAGGDAYLLATSNLPIADPVVRLIVEVSWASGRMLREYTLFLDPATVAAPAPAPAPRVDNRRVPAAAPAPAPQAEPEAPVTETAEPVSAPARPTAVPREGEYGPVRSGQTLWGIASDWARGTGLGVNEVMIAIQRQNPEAFLNGNINLLKRGAILRLPRVEEVERISTAAAIAEVSAQQQAFQSRSGAETVASPATPLLAEETVAPEPPAPEPEPTPEPEAAPRPEEAAEAEAAPGSEPTAEETEAPTAEAEPARDLLELVPPSEDFAAEDDGLPGDTEAESGATGVGADRLREDLARTEEELIAQQQQNAYLEERIRELESQLEDREEAGVADADMANMEERLRQQRQAQPAAPAEQPWYQGIGAWLIGLLVLVAAGVGWILSRRGRGEAFEEAPAEPAAPLREIQTEAEDVLRVLGDEPAAVDEAEEEDDEPAAEEASAGSATAPRRGDTEDAELLDEESSDPEIQLDLARAYISMGDKEAARVILEEVVANGNEEQQAEAGKMLEVLTSS